MYKFKHFLPLILLLSVFAACKQDDFLDTYSQSVTAAFAGRVVDENGLPLNGVQIRAGAEFTTTDENGVFRLQPTRLSADNAKLMVTKIGYYAFSRAYFLENNALETVTIQLLRRTQSGSVNAFTGGTLELPGGASLVFPAGAFVDERGTVYNGSVRVFARPLDASNPDFALHAPGDLRGISAAGETKTLGNHGMLGVELEGQSGQELRIRAGTEVEIHLPIASAQLASAPSEITLWHYDMQQARWMEEGTAQRVGNEYVGRVKHFTFWSFSTAFNVVELRGKVFLVDNQTPLGGAVVRLTMNSDSTKGYASVNAKGIFKGGVPMGETFVLDVLNECGELIFKQDIGPFTGPTDLPDIIVPNNGSQAVSVTGRLLDCSGAPIKNGYAQVLVGNFKWIAFTGVDGSFALNQIRCDTAVAGATVVGYDLQNLLQSAPDSIPLPPNTVAMGDLSVCDSLSEYILFSLDFNDYVIAAPVGGLKDSLGMRAFLGGYSGAQQEVGISMEFPNDGQAGSFQLSNLYVNSLIVTNGPLDVKLEITDSAFSIGEVFKGTFEGTFVDHLGLSHTLSGSFQVRRDY
jgi:hypothetical protein